MGNKCPGCGSQNDDGARFCSHCGKAMSGSTLGASRYRPASPGGTGDGLTLGYYVQGFQRYADFEGRASRGEFWWFNLVFYGINFAIVFLATVLGMFSPILETVFTVMLWVHGLGMFLPQLAVTARRLHDTGRSGWLMLLLLVPILGWIPLLIFLLQPSDVGPNKHGREPGS